LIRLNIEIVIPTPLERLFLPLVLLYRRLRYGYPFRLIRLAQPTCAKVDPEDYDRLNQFEWLAKKGRNSFYALRRAPAKRNGKETLIYMHQELIKVPDGMVIDHINHDGLDNRNANIRPATKSQNLCHRKKTTTKTSSKYKGVSRRGDPPRYEARIGFDRKEIYLGRFDDEIQAAIAYDNAAKKHHGHFASLNFPQ
jgi:hypothetical protein